MAQVKLSLNLLTVPEKLQLAAALQNGMAGNAAFPTPTPALNALATITGALQTAYTDKLAADQDAKMKTIALHNAEKTFDAAMTTEGGYIQVASGGEEAAILSSGAGVKSTGGKIGPLPAPTGLSASSGDLPCEIDLQWDKTRGADSYVGRMTVDPLSPTSVWTTIPGGTKSKASVPGLTAGTRYWFEVAALGAAGQSPWSEPVMKMALD